MRTWLTGRMFSDRSTSWRLTNAHVFSENTPLEPESGCWQRRVQHRWEWDGAEISRDHHQSAGLLCLLLGNNWGYDVDKRTWTASSESRCRNASSCLFGHFRSCISLSCVLLFYSPFLVLMLTYSHSSGRYSGARMTAISRWKTQSLPFYLPFYTIQTSSSLLSLTSQCLP